MPTGQPLPDGSVPPGSPTIGMSRKASEISFLKRLRIGFAAVHPPDANGAFHVQAVRLQVSARKA